MKIAITGSQGQLGAELCRQLAPEVVGLDLPEFDLTDRDRLMARLAEIRPQAVINTAAFTRVDLAETQEEACRAVNVQGVAHLIEACRALDCTLVQISTDYVFGGEPDRKVPFREDERPTPQGVYARSKLDAERIAATWPKHVIVRTCGLYGPAAPRSAGNFVDTILRLAGQGRSLRVVHDQTCTPSYVPHVARAAAFLATGAPPGTYHVVNSGQTTWYEMAAEILRRSEIEVPLTPITTAEYGAPAPRPAYSVLDTAKYHALTGRPPMPPWQEALAEYMAHRP